MTGHVHFPDDGRWDGPDRGRATCYDCRRTITFLAGRDTGRDAWRASGPFGPPLPKSRRCTSHNPAIGYQTCRMLRNHGGVCREGGYVWWRGKGHSRPVLVARPSWDRP